MLGLMGMAQVLAAVAYGIKGLRRGQTTWKWPEFDPDPAKENAAQMERWSINVAPDWKFPPSQLPINITIKKPTRPKGNDTG